MRVAKTRIPKDHESMRLASSESLAMIPPNRLPIMKKTIPVLVFLAITTALTLQAAPVSQIFEGVTVSNPAQPTALTLPLKFSLERAIEYIEPDELVEATPKNIRLRKRILDSNERKRLAKKG